MCKSDNTVNVTYMFLANLAHTDEIHTCYDWANYTRTVPGL